MTDLVVGPHARNAFGWLELIIMKDLPLNSCEDNIVCKYVNLKPMSVKTLKKYMHRLCNVVEKRLKKLLASTPYRGLMDDMWENGAGDKYLGTFVITPSGKEMKVAEINLLCMTPLLNETNCNGDNIIATETAALERVGLTFADFGFKNADNTSVNPSMARKTNVPLIGCKGHSAALGFAQDMLDAEEQGIIHKVAALCKKMREPKHRGIMRLRGVDLTPFILLCTPWFDAMLKFEKRMESMTNMKISSIWF